MKIWKKIFEYIFLFCFGGISYISIELLYRGHSHWTMFLLGGLCFVSVGLINEILPWKMLFELQALIGGLIITFLEFICGCIVNLILHWNIWDYSNLPTNILGQVCLDFTLIWIALAALIIFIDDWIRYKMFGEERPHYIFIWRR